MSRLRLATPLSARALGPARCVELGPDSLVLVWAAPPALPPRLHVELELGDGVDCVCELEEADGDRGVLRIVEIDDAGRLALEGHLSGLRKDDHLRIARDEDVEASTSAGWHRFRLPHDALPELHPDEVDLGVTLLGKWLRAPLLIAGMTGGSADAGRINRAVARVAQALGLGMGLGSQRVLLERPELLPTFAVRDVAPDILLLGNIGAVQLNRGVTVDDCRRLVEQVDADALAVHLNVLQELVQPEGDRDWRGLRRKVEALVGALGVPVVLKETGCGLPPSLCAWARDIGCAAVDVGGRGGTSWGWIEGFRATDAHRQAIGATFRDWGIPTPEAVRGARAAVGPDFPIVATGGLRTGLDVARAGALGATAGGMALPFFRAVEAGDGDGFGRRVIEELRIALTCTGTARWSDVGALRVEER